MKTFTLRISSIRRDFYTCPCESLVFTTLDGMVGILADHVPTVYAVSAGELRFTVNGETVTSAPCDMTIMDWATGTVSYQGETYEGIVDGAFEESTFRSAPYFTLRIDGIVEDAQ